MTSPHHRNQSEQDKFSGVPFKTYTLLQNSTEPVSPSDGQPGNRRHRKMANLIPEKLIPQKTLDIRTKEDLRHGLVVWNKENVPTNVKKHRKAGSTVNQSSKPRSRHTNSMIDFRVLKANRE